MKKQKIVVFISGGLVQEVYSDNKELDVVIVDGDTLEERGLSSSKVLDLKAKGLKEVEFNVADENDPEIAERYESFVE